MDVLDILAQCENEVSIILESVKSHHGIEHAKRVFNTSISICNELKELKPNVLKVGLISLCHDLDDYKLFNTCNNSNTKGVLKSLNLDESLINDVIKSINEIGYSKRLEGVIPSSIEAKIVSDSDMLDAMGVVGIVRSIEYSASSNRPFFDRTIFPIKDLDSNTYKTTNTHCVNHFFEKLFKLKDMMLTYPAKALSQNRFEVMVEFLRSYFLELNLYDWLMYLDNYLENN